MSQLVSGQNESKAIVKSSPQSSLLFPVKVVHHRTGSVERLRLSVYGILS